MTFHLRRRLSAFFGRGNIDRRNTIATAPNVEVADGGVLFDGIGGEAAKLPRMRLSSWLTVSLVRPRQGQVYQMLLG